MNLATMRTKLVSLTARTLDASDTTTLDELLNGAYQATLPGMLPGEATEGHIDVIAVDGVGEYAYPNWLIAVSSKAPEFTTGSRRTLDRYTRPVAFWNDYDVTSTTESRPTGALFRGRTVTLRPIPDQTYTVRVWGRIGKETALADSTDYERNMAMACVALAAIEHAELTGNAEIKGAAEEVLSRHFDTLLTQSLARSKGPSARVSF